MVFSSGVFLFIFLPVVLFLHTVIKNITAKNALLVIASLVFYAYGEPVYILMLIGSVAVNYIFGSILSHRKSKGILALAVILNLLLLFVYKYAGFVAGIFGLSIKKITMPIGISFFTFQAISYIVDTYGSKEEKKAGFFDVLLYISLFPQLIAGPIVKYNSIRDAIKDRSVTAEKMADGIRHFIIGLSKKMLISNTMGYAADTVFGMSTEGIGTPLAWLGAVAYTLQIYFDFSGYSDMAVGLGKAMGFDFPENFNYPYVAHGIRDFWRRWHMSLTGWFREYLYIPLGGNRKGRKRQLLNTLIVFTATGIWHGANYTFLVWGLFHGILMCIETLMKNIIDKKSLKPLKWLYTMFFVIIGFVIFRADTIGYGVQYLGRMFGRGASSGTVFMSLLKPEFMVTLIAALFAMCPITPFVKKKIAGKKAEPFICGATYVASLGLLFLCILTLAADSYNPFIYFRF